MGIQKADTISRRIYIEFIPHALQRYDTCGDYRTEVCGYEDARYVQTRISVSLMPDKRWMLLVAIHELIEWALCDQAGISNEDIDAFDICGAGHAIALDNLEPGDDIRAPYYRQHQVATGIERILAAELRVDWAAYGRYLEGLK